MMNVWVLSMYEKIYVDELLIYTHVTILINIITYYQ